MTADLLALVVIIAGCVLLVYVLASTLDAHIDGESDATSYRGIRSNDHYTGWKRAVYEVAFQRATDKAAIVKERNAKRDN